MSSPSLASVAGWALLAALCAALGPLLLRRTASGAPLGLGVAAGLAAGSMLGVGYLLMSIGLTRAGVSAAMGAVLGIGASYCTHLLLGLAAGTPLDRMGRAFVADALHAAPEGVAIGAALALAPQFGLFLVATMAIHNVWEGQVLGARLIGIGAARGRAAVLAAAANLPQVLLAVGAFALAVAMPASLAALLGFGFGALAYLSLAELLPESYRTTGRTSIALVVSVAAGIVALLGTSVQR